ILEPDNTVRYDSPAIERVLGYRLDERIGNKCRDYAHPDDVEGAKRAFAELVDKPGAKDSLEYKMRHADGSWRCVETVFSNSLDDPAVRGIVVNYRDVTERKETEEKLRESHTLLWAVAEGTTDAIFVKDRRSRYLMINPAGARFLGRPAEEIIGKDDMELFSPEDVRRIMEGDRETMATGVVNTSEDTKTAENVTRTYLTTKGPYRDHRGNVVGVFGISRDITERQRTEEALHASEARSRTVIEQSPMSIHIFAPDGHSLRANASWNELWNLGEGEEPEGANIFEDEQLRATGLLPYVEESVAGLHPVDAPPLFYDPARTGRDGSPRWLQASVYPVSDEAGAVIEMALTIEDITGRKKAEEELEKSEKRFRSMVQNASDVLAILETDATVRCMSPSIERVSGYVAEELVGVNVFDYIHPGDLERVANTFAKNLDFVGVAPPTEFRIRHVDGSWRYLEAVSNNLSNDPNIAGVVVNARDVTGRREAEEKLRKSEASLAEAQRMSNLGNWEWDVKTGEVSWSDEVYRIYGFAPREVTPTLDKLMERVHPDDRGLLRRAINGALYEGKPYDLEHRIIRPDGAERVVHRRAEVVFDEDGEPLRMIGTVHDITDRKRVEEALKESEERFRNAFEDAPVGVALVGLDRYHLKVNSAYCEMVGYSEEELLVKAHPEIVHPDDQEISAKRLHEALEGEGSDSYALERRYIHADGHAIWVVTSVSLIRDSRGEPSHLVCLHHDITDRKRAEEALRESEERFRTAFEDAPIGVAFVGTDDMRYLRVNHALCEMLGYSEEEMLEKTSPEITHPGDHEISADLARRALGGEFESYSLERRYLHADGHLAWNLTSVSLIRDSRGEPSHFVCLHQDTTE
ncbi:MAG: PAS domain S-box protein, partial [Rubrobacteraceae bacterium]